MAPGMSCFGRVSYVGVSNFMKGKGYRMSTVTVHTKDHGNHVFTNATASEEDGSLVVVEAGDNAETRFAMQDILEWRIDN